MQPLGTTTVPWKGWGEWGGGEGSDVILHQCVLCTVQRITNAVWLMSYYLKRSTVHTTHTCGCDGNVLHTTLMKITATHTHIHVHTQSHTHTHAHTHTHKHTHIHVQHRCTLFSWYCVCACTLPDSAAVVPLPPQAALTHVQWLCRSRSTWSKV